MKNFKRVISAVIALALSASTLVAVSAAKFTDVDSTNYAEAIDVLSALDVVHGYEDGSFKPDGEITRAEAATMIVGALNMMGDAQAAAGSSKFTDVNEKASWATGYVNVGVAQGFINGMNDTTFAPQENVTYAQMCVMLTKITGYGDYAESYGGWPTGYTTMAASSGINKGVAVSNDTPLKRGQVAQMLYNAVTIPVLGISEYRLDGNSYKKLDGTGTNEYKSILSDKFEGFEIKATVDSFPAAGEVKLTNITSDYKAATDADRFFTVKPTATTTGTINKAVIENGIDLSNSIQQQVRAILYVDHNDKIHLVFAAQTDAVETKEVAADDLENVDYNTNKKIKFGTTKYTFENTVKVYVNGDLYYTTVGTAADDTQIKNILDAATGNVKFAKVASNATNYDTIFVDAYIMGQVSNVSYKNESTTVKFSPAGNNLGSYKSITIADNDIDTDSVKISVTVDDKAIELKDLQEDDVIAIKTKIGAGTVIDSTNENITVLVSRDTISGKVSSIEDGTGENAFVINGETYAATDKANVGLKVGETYNTIYLDSFGRVYSYNDEAVEDSKNYAILAKVTDKTDITLVLPDGTRKAYEAKDASIYTANGGVKSVETPNVAVAGVTAGASVINCVVEYTVKSGQINSIKAVSPVAFTGAAYKESVAKVGTVGIGSATGVINTDGASSYKDYTAMKANEFIDEEIYNGAGFGKIGSTTTYSLVILTKAGFDYSANSRFAVIDADGWSKGSDADGDPVDQLKVLLNGEKTTLDFEPKFADSGNGAYITPVRGTAFFYTKDSDGLVDAYKPITIANITSTGTIGLAGLFGAGNYDNTKWGSTIGSNDDILLVKGLVVKTGTNSVSLLANTVTGEGPLDIDAFETYSLADDCVIYTYDTDSEVAAKDKLDAEGVLVAENFKNWRITDAPVATPAETYTDANTNGSYDLGESFVDANGNGVWDDAITVVTAYNGKIGQIVWGHTAVANDANGAAKLLARGINGTKLYDTLEGTKAADDAQYALALIVDDKVVEIYEILAD
ncbi:MAG: S-layer homology domain-containing protein [Clostridia bacterium]|nr:S-layer homology domain-containing protein [Clostridia bacterium]